MSKLYIGSICLSSLIEAAKSKHSSITKSLKNDKVYVNVALWLNDKPDQYGNDMSISLNSKKDKAEAEGKMYVGNAKAQVYSNAPSDNDLPGDDWADGVPRSKPAGDAKTRVELSDDMPF